MGALDTKNCVRFFATCLLLVVTVICGGAEQKDKGMIRMSAENPGAMEEVGVGDLYALVVGVSRYKDGRIPKLNVSHRDALDFADFLRTQKHLFKNLHMNAMTDEKATNQEINKQLYYGLSKSGRNDTVIVFLSGHGADDPKNPGEFFFLPYDADPEFLAATAVHMNRQWFLGKLDSKRVLLIADTCHAGGFAGAGTKSSTPAMERFVSQFQQSEGRIFLSSARHDELSVEKTDWGNSVFTHYLLEGLRGVADANKDGIVTLRELYDFVYDRTKDVTSGSQHPQWSGQLVGHFPLAVAALSEGTPLSVEESSQPSKPRQGDEEIGKLFITAERGDVAAQFKLGVMFEHGLLFPTNLEKAIEWYRKASKAGSHEAKEALARLQQSRTPSSAELRVADQDSQWHPMSPEDRIKVLRYRAERADQEAMYELGMRYLEGNGVEQDVNEAKNFLLGPARNGHPDAQFQIGKMFMLGRFYNKDLGEAKRWFQQAAEQGHKEAETLLQGMERSGAKIGQTPVKRRPSRQDVDDE